MSDADKTIADAMKELNKKYGEGSVMTMNGENAIEVQAIPTGCFTLDAIFGCGGLPRGRVVEMYGAESSGKSTMALYMVSQIQKAGGKAAWIDAEFSFSTDYARRLGVNPEELIVSQPASGEEALYIVDTLATTGAVDLIVVDSVAALVPKSELEGEIGDVSMAVQARMLSKGLRILTGNLGRTKTTVLMLNQTRDKIGVYYGSKVTTTGGNALKFYASVRLEVKKLKTLKDANDEARGTIMGICATKNKVAAPFKTGEIELIFGHGVNIEADLFDAAVSRKIIEKTGNTYTFEGEKLAVGRDESILALKENETLYARVRTAVESKT